MRFKRYILNEDYMRFLKKNKNLTQDQINDINDYFYKVNPHAGKKINWQSKDVQNWTYQDFMDLKQKYTSGIKSSKDMRCDKIRIPISDKEYIRVKMPTKEFCAFIPLTYDAAKMFNTRKLGVCSGPWCIGSTKTITHWYDIVVRDEKVPIYVINNESKWVVLIKPGNRSYEVWDIHNKENIATLNKNPIPDFDIKKNLLSPRQGSLYDKAREEIKKEKIDISKAMEDYEKLLRDMENAKEIYEKHIKYNREIIDNTIETYEEEAEYYKNEIDKLDNKIKELDDADEIEKLKNEVDEYEDELYKIYEILKDINSLDEFDMASHDYIAWTDTPYSEYDLDENTPKIDIEDYKDYIDMMEMFDMEGDYHVNNGIEEYIKGEFSYYVDPDDVLNYYDWKSPEVILEEE